MPFGSINSGSTYQRLMGETLRSIDRADPYVDDVCVHSSGFGEHLIDLKAILRALREANIQLRRDKCRFGYSKGEFVGHKVSKDGHHAVPRLVEKIKNAKIPNTKRELLRFLRLVNFYREHAPGFAEVVEPLYHLTRESVELALNEAAGNAFETLKAKLVDSPIVLAFPDWSSEFILQVDASSVAVGGVLAQEDRETTGKIRPIAFFSSGLTAAQRNYSAGELECWALIATSRKFRKYLQAAQHSLSVRS